jgi:acetylornithine deacetylase/succinyl-diaminopimelate desuccinylase-like protein
MTSPPGPSIDQSLDPAGEVVELCRELIRIDSSNYGDGSGPGERLAAEYVATKLEEVGIRAEVFESEPGRTSLIAHWGSGEGDPLLIHGHLDVVPAVAEDWQFDPFSGEIEDDMIWGRGAVDMKDFDAMLLSVVRARARTGRVPNRPLVLCFTADEEAGGIKGARFLVENHREHFEGVKEAIGEVGGFSTNIRGRRLYLIEAAEKGMAWIRLRANGKAGHGSMQHPDNAVARLAAAVARISGHEWPVRLSPTMEVLLATVGELVGTPATPDTAEELIQEFGDAARMIGAVIRNSANPTMLQAGYKVNVVPGQAEAWLDARTVPGYEDEFYATLADLVGEETEIHYDVRLPALETPFDGDIVKAMTGALLSHDPGSLVAPYLMSGGTDAKHFNQLGIRGFGFAPLRLPEDLDFTALFHGVNERVPVDSLTFGARVLDDFLDRVSPTPT